MRPLSGDKQAQIGMVIGAIGLFITLIISVLVVYNISASVDTTELDRGYNTGVIDWAGTNGTQPAHNSSTAINDQIATFFTVAPIIGIVIVAVVVISYVQKIGG